MVYHKHFNTLCARRVDSPPANNSGFGNRELRREESNREKATGLYRVRDKTRKENFHCIVRSITHSSFYFTSNLSDVRFRGGTIQLPHNIEKIRAPLDSCDAPLYRHHDQY